MIICFGHSNVIVTILTGYNSNPPRGYSYNLQLPSGNHLLLHVTGKASKEWYTYFLGMYHRLGRSYFF